MNDLQKSISSLGTNKNVYDEQVEQVERVKKDITDKEFFKAVLINLASTDMTPPDIICSSSFSDVNENEAECLLVNAQVRIDYSCRIGADRQEQYIAVEDYYENGIKKQRKVNKTRTVTDWSPYNGTKTTDETVMVRNDGHWGGEENGYRYLSNYMLEILSKCKQENVTPTDEIIKPTEVAINNAEEEAIEKCFESVDYPGDHHEGETKTGKAKIQSVSGVLLPEFALDYEYKGTKYRSEAYAFGELKPFTDFPKGDESEKVAKNIAKKTRPLTFVGISFILLAVVLIAVSSLVPEVNSVWAYISVGVGMALIIFNIFILRLIINSNVLKKQKSKKINDLKVALLKYGLPALTDDEIAKIKKGY